MSYIRNTPPRHHSESGARPLRPRPTATATVMRSRCATLSVSARSALGASAFPTCVSVHAPCGRQRRRVMQLSATAREARRRGGGRRQQARGVVGGAAEHLHKPPLRHGSHSAEDCCWAWKFTVHTELCMVTCVLLAEGPALQNYCARGRLAPPTARLRAPSLRLRAPSRRQRASPPRLFTAF
jgi:hypothetical protein